MIINARYAGKCAECGRSFLAGARIEWSRSNGVRCVGSCQLAPADDCPPEMADDCPPPELGELEGWNDDCPPPEMAEVGAEEDIPF